MKEFIFIPIFYFLFNQGNCFPSNSVESEGSISAVQEPDFSSEEIQRQVKAFVAQYLAQTGDDELLVGRMHLEDNPLPSEFGRERVKGHHNHHHSKFPVAAAAAAVPVLAATDNRIAQPLPVTTNNEAARVDTPTAAQNQTVRNDTVATATSIPIINAPVAAATPAPVVPAAASVTTAAPVSTSPRVTVDPVHHINQVNKILGNVATGNIVGIVDESLAIRAPPPVRTLVTNILKVVFCNPIDRIFRRCAPNQVAAANTSQE